MTPSSAARKIRNLNIGVTIDDTLKAELLAIADAVDRLPEWAADWLIDGATIPRTIRLAGQEMEYLGDDADEDEVDQRAEWWRGEIRTALKEADL